MKHSFFRKKAKRAVSLLAAASVAAGQLATTTALNVTAIDTAPNAEISPQKTLWWGDEKPTTDTAVIYGDADGNKSVNAVDASLIARYAAKGDISDIDLKAADVDLDGKVTIRDAELVLKEYQLVSTSKNESILPYTGTIEWKYYPNPDNYEVFNDGMTWQEAEEFCESRGGHLVTITSEQEIGRAHV